MRVRSSIVLAFGVQQQEGVPASLRKHTSCDLDVGWRGDYIMQIHQFAVHTYGRATFNISGLLYVRHAHMLPRRVRGAGTGEGVRVACLDILACCQGA